MLRRTTVAWALLAACWLLPRAAAQEPQQTELPSAGNNALRDEYYKHREILKDLFKGVVTAKPDQKQHQEAIDAAAKWSTYRFTWSVLQEPGRDGVE